ncbi:hypothetical protein Tco_1375069 [Tanacetum coccineum]
MTIGCCEVGGGGGVVGGVGVVCGDGVDRGVGGVDCRVVCAFVCGVVCGVGFSWSHGAERKDSFVKCDMTRNDNFVGVQVKAPISAMIVRVPEKDRWDVIVDGGGGEDIKCDKNISKVEGMICVTNKEMMIINAIKERSQ